MTDPTPTADVTAPVAAPTPTDPDPQVRNAYFAQAADAVIELGKTCGLAFAVERAIRNHWYDGMTAGIDAYATQRGLERTRG